MINRKFINFKTYNGFLDKKNEIPEDSIVFIQDRQCIWARGKEYICDGGSTLINSLANSLSSVAFTGIYTDLIGIPVVDSQLDINSSNAVENRKIKEALDKKANKQDLSQYVKTVQHIQDLSKKQNALTEGYGISIINDVISSTLDTTIYEIITEFPPQNPSHNKIYLLENNDGTFQQWYLLENGQWRSSGNVAPSINLSAYYKKTDAQNEHNAIWEYLNGLDFAPYALIEDVNDIRRDLNKYALEDYVNETFVRKSDVYYEGCGGDIVIDPNTGDVTIDPSGPYQLIIDNKLSEISENPVQNRIITRALRSKVDESALSEFATKKWVNDNFNSSSYDYASSISQLQSAISSKQNTLTAGNGISIIDDVISTTLDTSVYVIVDELPTINIDDNKIYIVETINGGERTYTQYKHSNGQWVNIGNVSPTVDLSQYQRAGNYLTVEDAQTTYLQKTEAQITYQPKGNYALASDVEDNYQQKGNYIDADTFDEYISELYETFQRKGAYALTTDVENALIALQRIIDEKYVLKKDVYNPENPIDWSQSDPTQIDINPSQGGGNDDSGDDEPGNHEPSEPIYVGPKLVTLTVAQYEQLIEEGTTTVKGNTIEFSADTYYFTYEGEPETSNWGFGDQFPVILTDNWAFGGTFPITLR